MRLRIILAFHIVLIYYTQDFRVYEGTRDQPMPGPFPAPSFFEGKALGTRLGEGGAYSQGVLFDILYVHVWPMRWAPFWGRPVIRARVYSRKYSNCLKCGNVNIKVLYTVHDTSMKLQTIIELK